MLKTLLDCPHCGNPGVSFLRKMYMGPAISAACRSCGKRVGVPYTAMLAIIPLLVVGPVALAVESHALGAVLLIAGFTAMSYIHMCWIPLEPR